MLRFSGTISELTSTRHGQHGRERRENIFLAVPGPLHPLCGLPWSGRRGRPGPRPGLVAPAGLLRLVHHRHPAGHNQLPAHPFHRHRRQSLGVGDRLHPVLCHMPGPGLCAGHPLCLAHGRRPDRDLPGRSGEPGLGRALGFGPYLAHLFLGAHLPDAGDGLRGGLHRPEPGHHCRLLPAAGAEGPGLAGASGPARLRCGLAPDRKHLPGAQPGGGHLRLADGQGA